MTWMEKFKPGKDPVVGKVSAEFKMLKDGRYLQQEFKGEMMGKPFTGTGIIGFDRVTGKYANTWIDNFTTSLFYSTGTSKDTGKTLEFTDEHICPMTNQPMKSRSVFKIVDADTLQFEMYEARDGKELKGMEMAYKRKK